jgi:hypothetical protein
MTFDAGPQDSRLLVIIFCQGQRLVAGTQTTFLTVKNIELHSLENHPWPFFQKKLSKLQKNLNLAMLGTAHSRHRP